MRALGRQTVLVFAVVVGAMLPSLSLGETLQEEEEEASAGRYYVVPEDPYSLALPQWHPGEVKEIDQDSRPVNLGGGLYPNEVFPLVPVPMRFRDYSPEAIRFLSPEKPVEGKGAPQVQDLPPVGVPRTSPLEIPEPYRKFYFERKPKYYINDIQRLLTRDRFSDIGRFLAHLANQSEFKAHFLIFDKDERLPDGVDMQVLFDQWFQDPSALLIVYHYGDPTRTQILMSGATRERFGEKEISRMLSFCIKGATEKKLDPSYQLEKFCMKLFVRLEWLQRRGNAGTVTVANSTTDTEGAQETAAEKAEGPGFFKRLFRLFIGIIAVAGLVVIGVVGFEYVTSLRKPVVFPERTMYQRLGGPYSGGGSALVSFGDAEQKDN